MYLIVGATGSLGGSVAKALLQCGHKVRAVVRPSSPLRNVGRFTDPDELRQLGAELVEGDLLSAATLAPHLEGVTAVLSTASGTKRAPPDTLEAVDLRGTSNLAAMAKAAGVKHLVYVSTRGAAEQAPGFLRLKWAVEQAVREAGPPATFVRPAPFMQDWIGFVYGAQLQGGTRVQTVGSTDPLRTYVDEADVAKVITELLLAGPPAGAGTRVVDLVADNKRSSQIVERMAALSGLPLTREVIPVGATVDTVPQPVATTITELLTMMADLADDPGESTETWHAYGVEPRTVDDFLRHMLAGAGPA